MLITYSYKKINNEQFDMQLLDEYKTIWSIIDTFDNKNNIEFIDTNIDNNILKSCLKLDEYIKLYPRELMYNETKQEYIYPAICSIRMWLILMK